MVQEHELIVLLCVINQADLESVLILEKRESIIERLGRFMKNHEYISRVDLLTYGKYNQNIHHRTQKYIWPYVQMESTLLIFTIIYYHPHQKQYSSYHIDYKLWSYFINHIACYMEIRVIASSQWMILDFKTRANSSKLPYFSVISTGCLLW